MINVQSVVCPDAPGYAIINISQPAAELNRPHIFTIFRTTNSSVSLDFTATDSAGKAVAQAAVNLQQASRRLESDLPLSGRQLSARRRFGGGYSGGSSYSSPRRRTPSPPPSPPYTSPRRRTGTPSTASTGSASGSRRRTFGYDNKVHNNPSNPGAGNYGYQTPGAAASNFGGRIPTGTPYGYTGANAYSGSSGSGAKIAMAAGGGLLAGYLGSQLLHSWTGYSRAEMLNMPCTSGSWQGLCSTCVTLHGARNCNIEISPKIDATRDDLLDTGFVPSQVSWPIQVNITKIIGVDFAPSVVCPNASDPQWTSAQKQLFITLTTLQELASGPQATASSGSSMLSWLSWAILAVIGGCCCFGICFVVMRRSGSPGYGGYGSSSESDWSEDVPHGAPPGYGYGGYAASAAPAAPVGHPIYGTQMAQPNPYWQGAAQPTQGVVIQGSPVTGGTGRYASGGFMDTAAPNGSSWTNLCQHHDVIISNGMIAGPWGECLAWAVAYEQQNPGWHQDPRFAAEGPAGQVIGAITAKANPSMLGQVVEAAERLEQACQQAIQYGQPLPLINRRV